MPNTLASTISERKLVTIMFIDMVDSLSAIRDVDPEEAHDLLSETLALMSDSIHSFGGVVARTLGDGVMALFGAPAAQEDHATRAALAALRVQEQLSGAHDAKSPIRARIGIHSGIVAIGGSPNDFGVDYDATGVVVHVAARLQALAPPGKAVVTGNTKGLIGRDITTEFLGCITIRGLPNPLDTFVLVGPAPVFSKPPTLGRGEFIGRAWQLHELERALVSSSKGNGSLVSVVGEAGVGKTTLIEQFITRCSHDMRFFLTRTERYIGTAPFQPFRDLILQLFGIETRNGRQMAKIISRQLKTFGILTEKYMDAVYDLCDLPVQSIEWNDLEPRQRRQHIISTITDILNIISQKRSLVICIEDIQRADSATIELIRVISDSIGSKKILLIVTCRPDFRNTWNGKIQGRIIHVNNLSKSETSRLVRRLLGGAASTSLATVLASRSGGNPLFLYEFVRSLTETGILGGTIDRRILLKETWEATAPLSVAAIIAERIDGLPSDLREAVLAASVLGEQFSIDMLAKVTDLSVIEIRKRLRFLERAQVIQPTTPEGVYDFVHGLFQEVAYATLLKRRRQKLHEAAFKALTNTPSTEPAIEQLAHHAFNGGVWPEALKYCWLAGRRAAARWSHREAVTHLENAVLAHSQVSPQADIMDAIDLRLELRLAHLPLLHLSRVGEVLEEARDLAAKAKERFRLAKIDGLMGGHAYLTRNPMESAELCRRSLKLARREDSKETLVASSLYLAQAQYALGRIRQSITTLGKIVSLIEEDDRGTSVGLPGRASVLCSRWTAIAKAELGLFQEAEHLAGKVLFRTESMQPFEYIYAQATLGFVLLIKGEFEAALIPSKLALEGAEKTDTPFMIPVTASQVGWLLAKQGRSGEALEFGRRAVRAAENIGISAGRSRWNARLAEVCLSVGARDEALNCVELAEKIAREASEPLYLCSALRLKGRIVAEAYGSIDRGRADMVKALVIARRLDLGPEIAKCHFDLGKLEMRAKKIDAARMELSQADREFRRYGMASWSKRAEDAALTTWPTIRGRKRFPMPTPT
jgi:class 3 adenylate cyclase/tetratricopeptide (TPR) repeat protein